MKKAFLRGIIGGLGFLLTLIIGGLVYIKATSISDVTSGQPLTASLFNSILGKINNINFNSGTNNLEINGGLKISSSNSCDSSNKGVLRSTTEALQVCDGNSRNVLQNYGYGTNASNPGTNCVDIKSKNSSATDGFYRIKPSSNAASKTYCDMTNGGRTLVVRIFGGSSQHYNTATVGSLSGINQSSTWKLADLDITTMNKTTGYKFVCGSVTNNFGTTCSFGATTLANGACGTYCAGSTYGVGTYDCGAGAAGQAIYARTSTNGCWSKNDGGVRGNSGQLWVK